RSLAGGYLKSKQRYENLYPKRIWIKKLSLSVTSKARKSKNFLQTHTLRSSLPILRVLVLSFWNLLRKTRRSWLPEVRLGKSWKKKRSGFGRTTHRKCLPVRSIGQYSWKRLNMPAIAKEDVIL